MSGRGWVPGSRLPWLESGSRLRAVHGRAAPFEFTTERARNSTLGWCVRALRDDFALLRVEGSRFRGMAGFNKPLLGLILACSVFEMSTLDPCEGPKPLEP